jgi:hypothetical protein
MLRIVFVSLTAALLAANTSRSAPPGPRYDYPKNGQKLDLEGDYLFKVREVSGASDYLWGFVQNGKMVWENQTNEGKLSGPSYGLVAGSAGWNALHAGVVEVWCRALVNNEWTEATKIKITLRPRPAPKLDDSEAGKLARALVAMSPIRQPQEIERLRDQKGPDNTVALALALPHLSSRMQQAARDALAQRLARMSSKTLSKYLQDDEPEIRRAAVRVCEDKGKKEFVPRLIVLLGDREPAVARSAYAALKGLTGQDFGPAADADAAARRRATDEWQAWWKKNGTTDDTKSPQ